MYSDSILTQEATGKKFKVTFHSHWSNIEALDGSETDRVKFGWDNLYVGFNSGHSYTVDIPVPKELPRTDLLPIDLEYGREE